VKKSRFTEEQIIGILKQHEAGVKTADLCRCQVSPPQDRTADFGGMLSDIAYCVTLRPNLILVASAQRNHSSISSYERKFRCCVAVGC